MIEIRSAKIDSTTHDTTGPASGADAPEADAANGMDSIAQTSSSPVLQHDAEAIPVASGESASLPATESASPASAPMMESHISRSPLMPPATPSPIPPIAPLADPNASVDIPAPEPAPPLGPVAAMVSPGRSVLPPIRSGLTGATDSALEVDRLVTQAGTQISQSIKFLVDEAVRIEHSIAATLRHNVELEALRDSEKEEQTNQLTDTLRKALHATDKAQTRYQKEVEECDHLRSELKHAHDTIDQLRQNWHEEKEEVERLREAFEASKVEFEHTLKAKENAHSVLMSDTLMSNDELRQRVQLLESDLAQTQQLLQQRHPRKRISMEFSNNGEAIFTTQRR